MIDPEKLWYPHARSASFFFYRQVWHLLALLVLVPSTWLLVRPFLDDGRWLGLTNTSWFWLSIGLAVVHQVVVWIVFRLQIGWATLTRVFGRADLVIWGVLFQTLLTGRIVAVIGLAQSTQNSLPISHTLAIVIALFLIIPFVYTIWSVFKYFGLVRAMVGDHFRIKYRQMPLEDRGIFKYSSNAMYTFGFLALWVIGLLHLSIPALLLAAFNHIYIWVHYFCTEKPDMEIIFDHQ
jgi:hypothetical protein